ncbi:MULTISPECIES: hypothetical protein [unclassified Treponema]|uniref:hypothetical protein n=1 Tax=unclassified Treponema TaxID=2638727 RepID=UPI0005301130|nr:MULTISPECIES: hypothetical protein [unclassified Treponema]AIW88909.1 hypothetical protein JO41_03100 [Treponema sp. OMZ 838]UTC51143.1 hypothetical protein E4N65_01995 [Treponema sp. OMZ 855]
MKEKILVMLSTHVLGDNRITKYQDFFLEHGVCKVLNIHFLNKTYKNTDKEIVFSISGNKLRKRMDILCRRGKIINDLGKLIPEDIEPIFMIHDPILLILVAKLKLKWGKAIKVIYDRHEYYETLKTLRIFPEFFLYEKLFINSIDFLICVNKEHRLKTCSIFRKIDINNSCIVHNYPTSGAYISASDLLELKGQIPFISYVGSLNWHADRDVELMIDCVKALEAANIKYACVFAGTTSDDRLIKILRTLQESTNNRFQYLGTVSRDVAVKVTAKSHIGFYFFNNSCILPCSPNKIFEYIYYGVIPFARYTPSDDLTMYNGNIYDFTIDRNQIIQDFVSLVSDRELVNKKVNHIIKQGCPFLWENDMEILQAFLAK